MKYVAKFPYQGDTQNGQLSFPAGAVIVQSTDGQHAPRNGWMHGDFQGSVGWFPESHVEPVSSSSGKAFSIPEANAVPTTSNNTSAPVANAIPVNDGTPAAASVPMPPPAQPKLDENQISQLIQQGFTRGLAMSLNDSKSTFAKRIWIVDNSGSMQKTDGHRFVDTTARHQVKIVDCSRWEEITECVCYHIQLAALLKTPTSFRLLNDPGIHVGPQQFTIDTSQPNTSSNTSPINAMQIIHKARPGGSTPLTDHIMAIHAEVEQMEPQLRANGQKVAIIIATDGLPTDDRGYGGKAHQEQFVSALRMLEGFPVWVVIRLCTDEEDVVNFYNDLDNQLELSMEVLDDFVGEAEEVHEHNPWLNYALPLHRMREMGYHDRVFDMLDERRLTLTELRDFVGILIGPQLLDGMPDPSANWEAFLRRLDQWLHQNDEAPQQWNPIKKKVKPWLDVKKMNRVYGDKSCVIM